MREERREGEEREERGEGGEERTRDREIGRGRR